MSKCDCAENNDGMLDMECEHCVKWLEEEHNLHFSDYKRFSGHNDNGDLIDVRDPTKIIRYNS